MKKIASILAAGFMIAAMTVSVFAEEGTGFVNSIEQKPAPTVQSDTTVTVNGKEVAVENLEEEMGVQLVVTPVSEKEDAPNSEISESLAIAYNEISASNSSEISFVTEEDQAAFSSAKEDAEARGKTLVASNIFDISLVDITSKENVDIDGITVSLAVDNADELVLVMHKPDDTWEVVPFTNNGDGTITLTLSSLSPIAFFIEAEAAGIPVDESGSNTTSEKSGRSTAGASDNGKVTSPDTGADFGSVMLISAFALAAAAAVCVVCAKKS